MLKKILIITGILAVALIFWYFVIKPYDYLVTFPAKTSPGTIHTGIREWGNVQGGLETESIGFKQVTQQLKAGDSTLTFAWEMIPRNDSVTRVKVRITDPGHSLQNKIAVLFGQSTIENIAVNRISDFKKGLEEHLETFKVKIEGISEIPETFCACTSIQTKQPEKAQGMKRHYFTVSDLLTTNGIRLKGVPFVEVTDWDMKNQVIHFNFCFPVDKKDSLPESREVFYRTIPVQKAIKATFNGKYNTSDRAWFALVSYADRNNLNISAKPLEIFYNNPNLGGDPLKWKTEVFMPIKEK